MVIDRFRYFFIVLSSKDAFTHATCSLLIIIITAVVVVIIISSRSTSSIPAHFELKCTYGFTSA